MRGNCFSGGGGGSSKSGIVGIVLMAVGVLVLLLFVPYWVWTSVCCSLRKRNKPV